MRGRQGAPGAAVSGRRQMPHLRKFADEVFKAAGQKGRTGAHAFRIGGATDLADEGASQSLLQAKGRWASDIGRIYARMTRRAQISASKAMQRSSRKYGSCKSWKGGVNCARA